MLIAMHEIIKIEKTGKLTKIKSSRNKTSQRKFYTSLLNRLRRQICFEMS